MLEVEVAGYNVIGALLKEFFNAILYPKSAKSQKLLLLVSQQFPITGKPEDLYFDTQAIVDFISGMTDLFAVDMYRKITGISLSQL